MQKNLAGWTVLFDLDGTLIDTELASARAVEATFLEWGYTLVPDDAHYIVGRTWEKAVDYLVSRYSLQKTAKDVENALLERYRKLLPTDCLPVPGGSAAVRSLANSAQFQMGLVSGSRVQDIEWALNHLKIRDCFEVVLGAENYARSKPEPDGYLAAMHKMGALPERTLIFEDSEAGIRSAISAGAWVVALTATNHFGTDQSQAHERIPDLKEVDAEWVKRFFQKRETR